MIYGAQRHRHFLAEVSTGKMENGSSALVTTIVEVQGISYWQGVRDRKYHHSLQTIRQEPEIDGDLFEEGKEPETTCVLGLNGHDQNLLLLDKLNRKIIILKQLQSSVEKN
jgi:hypothetical protein